MKFKAARFWNKIQWLDLKIGYQDSRRRKWPANWHGLLNCELLSVALHFFRNYNMYLHISSSLSLLNHPWISQNENCILVNSSLPLIRAFWDPLISPFWSPSKHFTSLVTVTEYLLVSWGVSLPKGGSIYHYSILTGGSLYHGGQNTISHRPNPSNLSKWPRPSNWWNVARLLVHRWS